MTFQAIVVTEIGVGRPRCFDRAMNELLDVASKDLNGNLAQVKVGFL